MSVPPVRLRRPRESQARGPRFPTSPPTSILSFVSCAPSIFRTLLQLHPRSPSNPNSHVSCPFLPPRVIKSKIRLLSQLLNQSTNPPSAARCQLNTTNYSARRNTYLKGSRLLFLMLSDPPTISPLSRPHVNPFDTGAPISLLDMIPYSTAIGQ